MHLNIQITKDHTETLTIYERDIPIEASKAFVNKFRLNPKVEPLITKKIVQEVKELLKIQLANSKSAYIIASSKKGSTKASQKINMLRNSIEQLQREKLDKSYRENTFHPDLNRKTKQLVTPSKNKFNELYEDAVLLKEKKVKSEEQFYSTHFSFKPTIIGSHSTTSTPVAEKLLAFSKRKERNLEEQRTKQNSLIESSTGQRLFSPQIGRPQITPRTQPIWDSPVKSPSQQAKAAVPVSLPLFASQKLTIDRKIAIYYEIFNSLGPSKAGYIQGNTMKTENIHIEFQGILKPLLEELKVYREPVDFTFFAKAIEKLYVFLAPTEKSLFYTKAKPVKDLVLSPKEPRKLYKGGLYERSLHQKCSQEEKAALIRKSLFANETMECTFKPTITPYKKPLNLS